MKEQKESRCTPKTISLLSPLGKIQVSGCENGVHTIQILMDVAPAERSGEPPLSCCVVNGGPAETGPELRRCVEWLQAYFNQPRSAETLLLPPPPAFHHPALSADTFTSRVLHVLMKDVKMGETVSYKRLAEMAGNPAAARAVGGAMRRNPIPLIIPCHRVISSSGQSGPYMGGRGDHLKQWLLAHERRREEG
nr:methylated-DNA--protein-cysteine methyltransferase isoform X2 [Doryrhamphus excisus]XP_057914093.1 methylated-DNA--protein-cysteine methyltransferase isoform X2 [Doryrhamphus excisus]XP_057914094.1 methylated-DNA--protein-cysteine methyltransferase isoform X2 [Doryrhamphus excisus]XP_057914095.1 methylated-DNA--protein-cysteine methyltransferase isoform X2 [Doryrhamphus excisus]XP_057914096.1 methylated-DNA--protein-cysteine methyltransferase isoform X2 [Doryrhamphus excisus]XP_057914098.1 